MRHASKILFPWSCTADFALACQDEAPHQGRQRVRDCERKALIDNLEGEKCFGPNQSCCVPWHKAGQEGKLHIFKDKQPVHQLNWCLSRASTAVCRGLSERSMEIPARGGGTLPPAAVFLVSPWREGRSLCLAGSPLPNQQHGHCMPPEKYRILSGCWIHALLLKL